MHEKLHSVAEIGKNKMNVFPELRLFCLPDVIDFLCMYIYFSAFLDSLTIMTHIPVAIQATMER